MRRVFVVALLLGLLWVAGCSFDSTGYTVSHESVDRSVTGKAVSVDQERDFTTIALEGGMDFCVTNASFSHISVTSLLSKVWRYDLHFVPGQAVYDLVKVE